MRGIIILMLVAAASCSIGKSSSVSVENNSGQFIDSLVIDANGFFLKFYKIPSGVTVIKKVRQEEIKGGHDIKMTPTIYTKGEPVKGLYFYNDLIGFQGNYKMALDKQLKVKWTWKTEY